MGGKKKQFSLVVLVAQAGINYLIEVIAAGGSLSDAKVLGWPVTLVFKESAIHFVHLASSFAPQDGMPSRRIREDATLGNLQKQPGF